MRDDVAAYLRGITNHVTTVFGARVTGVWVVGSAAFGGFGPTSDLDVQAATEVAPTSEEIDHLVGLITPNLSACPAEGLEFVLYDRAALADPVPPLQWSLNLNGGPARAYRVSTDPASESWHWFVLDLAMARESAVTLHGLPMSDVVGEISRDVQLAAIDESLRWHAVRDPYGPNHLGNAARALRYVETGIWGSKPAGIAWLAETGRSERDAVATLRDLFDGPGAS